MKKFLRFHVERCNETDIADDIMLTNEFESGTEVSMGFMSFTTEKTTWLADGCAIVNKKRLNKIRRDASDEIEVVYEYVESYEEEDK